jgi:hypothetical protein
MVTRLCPSNIPNQDTQKVIELNILNHMSRPRVWSLHVECQPGIVGCTVPQGLRRTARIRCLCRLSCG